MDLDTDSFSRWVKELKWSLVFDQDISDLDKEFRSLSEATSRFKVGDHVAVRKEVSSPPPSGIVKDIRRIHLANIRHGQDRDRVELQIQWDSDPGYIRWYEAKYFEHSNDLNDLANDLSDRLGESSYDMSTARKLLEGIVHIHIHGDGKPVVGDMPEEDEETVETRPDDRPTMPSRSQVNAPNAQNYVLKVKRDAQGRVAEIYATKLG